MTESTPSVVELPISLALLLLLPLYSFEKSPPDDGVHEDEGQESGREVLLHMKIAFLPSARVHIDCSSRNRGRCTRFPNRNPAIDPLN